MADQIEVGVKKESKSRRLVCGWRVFIVMLTIAILATIGGVVGYYVVIGNNNQDVIEEEYYFVGVSREDVTGPIVQVNMMGYAHPEQIATGLHTRLYSRAFVIADATKKNRVAFVSFDGGMTSQLIKLEIVKRLQERIGDVFSERNLAISGTHTHSGPAGYFQYLLFEITSLGHIEQATETLIEGITQSIVKANAKLEKARIRMGRADVDTGNINRSPTSYLLNPEEERKQHKSDTDQEITVLRFDSLEGSPIGMISWYPVHPTNMNFSNLLINSDNKGRASMLFEAEMRKEGEVATGKEKFVAAFAASNLGDVSPRTEGPICVDSGKQCEPLSSTCNNRSQNCVGFGPGKDMFESTDIIARKQVEGAWKAYNSAYDVIKGPISWAHQFVDMPNAAATMEDGTELGLCRPGMGYSFASGCTDGAGAFDFVQGMTEGTEFWDNIRRVIEVIVCTDRVPREYDRCHEPKPVLFPTGYMDKPYDWHPTIVDVQILQLGQFLISAVPGEFTTMAGRRLRLGLLKQAREGGMLNNTHVVISGLANVYTHYISTAEEYRAQRYEAASVIFGINTLAVYQEKYGNLLRAIIDGEQDLIDSGPHPPISAINQSRFSPVPGPDLIPEGIKFGDVIDDVNSTYSAGDDVMVKFHGANPRHNMKLGLTYLEVQQEVAKEWVTVYNDADWSTRFHWEEATPTTSSSHDVNLFSAMFDVIADATGMKFDFAKAMELYEKGVVWTKDEGEDYEEEGKKRLLETLLENDLLRLEEKPKPKAEWSGESYVTIYWQIPYDQNPGVYRIVYHGDYMNANREIISFTGNSSIFTVQ